jgi:tetratricopeptide (TPR) repeat protein
VVIALDVSDSMNCSDVAPTRLDRAVSVLRQTLDRLPDATWGLVVGAGDARRLIPLTQDRDALTAALSDPDLGRSVRPGSDLALLLATAGSLLPASGPGRAIVVASDGEELEGEAGAAADALRRSGIAIVPLISGTTGGGPVARPAGKGGVTYARDATGALVRSRARPELMRRLGGNLQQPVDALSPTAPRELEQALVSSVRAAERETAPVHGAPFTVAAALLVTGSFLLWPWRRAAFALLLLLSVPLAAAEPPVATPSALQRALPGSALLLERSAASAAARGAWEEARQEYALAAALKPGDEALRLGLATAQAREGDLKGDSTLVELAAVTRLAFPSWYNLGTARLLRGDLPGAVEALRRAVASDPGRPEAWRNLELALVALERDAGRPAPPSDVESREQLVQAAARTALQPLPAAQLPEAGTPSGRDW